MKRAWHVKLMNRAMQREAASRACGKRGVLCTYCLRVFAPHWPTGLLFKRVGHLGRCARRVRFIVACE